MAVLTKEKKVQTRALTVANYSSIYNLAQTIKIEYLFDIMKSNSLNNSKDKAFEEFKAKVIELMRADGASESFIVQNLTDTAIEDAIINNFTAESLAWALLQ